MECSHSFLKTKIQKIKTGELYSQMPHNDLIQALFALNFLKMDVHEKSAVDRFWHDGTKVTFSKARWRDLCTGLWRGPNPVSVCGRGHVSFLTEWGSSKWLAEHLLRCVQQKGTTPDAIVGPNDSTEELEGEPVFLTSSYHHAEGWGKGYLNQRSWLTTSCCRMRRERISLWGLVSDS